MQQEMSFGLEHSLIEENFSKAEFHWKRYQHCLQPITKIILPNTVPRSNFAEINFMRPNDKAISQFNQLSTVWVSWENCRPPQSYGKCYQRNDICTTTPNAFHFAPNSCNKWKREIGEGFWLVLDHGRQFLRLIELVWKATGYNFSFHLSPNA